MEEQIQNNSSVAGYDEAEGVTYDELQQDNQELNAQDNQNFEEPEIAIQDGEVKFRDDFFGDINDEPDEIERQEKPERVEAQETIQTQEPSQALYTDEEYRNTPFTQWDIDRLPEAVKPYANAVREQMLASQRQQQIQQQIANNPEKPPYIQEVKEYTVDELSSEAEKLACQKLGITDPEDFEPAYESRHAAAREMAIRELLQKRNEQVAEYKRQSEEYGILRQVNAEIEAKPDFKEYQQWFKEQAQREGVSPEQLNAGLQRYAKATGNYKEVAKEVARWYMVYQNSKALQQQQAQQQAIRPQPRQRPVKPPVLEGTQGGYQGKRTYNVKQFGELDNDQQAQALMDMGIV